MLQIYHLGNLPHKQNRNKIISQKRFQQKFAFCMFIFIQQEQHKQIYFAWKTFSRSILFIPHSKSNFKDLCRYNMTNIYDLGVKALFVGFIYRGSNSFRVRGKTAANIQQEKMPPLIKKPMNLIKLTYQKIAAMLSVDEQY